LGTGHWWRKIHKVLKEGKALDFWGEGYRKVWARPRFEGIPTSKERVRRLMREQGLQAPTSRAIPAAPMLMMEPSSQTIPDAPNRIWGTDATQVRTREEGVATVFVAVDHFVGDAVGIRAARSGTRFEAPEPIHQGVREDYGPLAKDVADSLVLRHDHGRST